MSVELYFTIAIIVFVLLLPLGVKVAVDQAEDREDLTMYLVLTPAIAVTIAPVWPLAILGALVYLAGQRAWTKRKAPK